MKTLSLHASGVVLCLFLCMLFFSRTRKTYPGFNLWTLSSFCSFFGLLLIGVRGMIPDFFSVVIANCFLVGSVWLLPSGMLRFAELPERKWLPAAALGMSALLGMYFTYVQPSVAYRIIFITAVHGMGVTYLLLVLRAAKAPFMTGSGLLLKGSLWVGLIWAVIRVVFVAMYQMNSQDFLASSVINGVTLTINSFAFITICFSLCALNFQRIEYDLSTAWNEVKVLKGIIPICCCCKNVRDDKGYWNQVEAYVRDHSEAEFSHGYCPDCLKKNYPGFLPEPNA